MADEIKCRLGPPTASRHAHCQRLGPQQERLLERTRWACSQTKVVGHGAWRSRSVQNHGGNLGRRSRVMSPSVRPSSAISDRRSQNALPSNRLTAP